MSDNNMSDRGDMSLRWQLAQQMGQNGIGGDLDLYEVFNWPDDPSVEDYYSLFLRNGYANAVISAPVDATWRDSPTVSDDNEDTEDSAFEQSVQSLDEAQSLWHYCKRADLLAGIGEYGVLVLELDDIEDVDDFDSEVQSASELTGLRPFSQASVEDIELGGPASGRWGKPLRYKLDLSDEDDVTTTTGPDEMWVHHSRLIHIPSDGLLDDEIRGTPRAEAVLNNLIDIQKTRGSAAEVSYRASAWGLNVNIDKDFNVSDGGDQMKEHLERWYYGLEPMLRTQGADVQSLGGEDIDPGPVIDVNVEEISATTGIPQSVLKGNETGERATTQDLKEWYGKVMERRTQFVTPKIVRALLNRLLGFGILDEPVGSYDVEWEPLDEPSEKEIAETQNTRADSAQKLSTVIPEFTGEDWKQFIEDGELPDVADVDISELEDMDVSMPDVSQPAIADGGSEDGE